MKMHRETIKTQIPCLSKIRKFINAKAGGTYGNYSVVKGYDVGSTINFIFSSIITFFGTIYCSSV